jgi:hypothetical protein
MLYFKNFLVGLVLILLVKPHRQFLSKYNKNIKEGNITFEKEWKLLTYRGHNLLLIIELILNNKGS